MYKISPEMKQQMVWRLAEYLLPDEKEHYDEYCEEHKLDPVDIVGNAEHTKHIYPAALLALDLEYGD